MTTTMCDSGAVKLKAGANLSTAVTDPNYTQLINQAESQINSVTRIDYTAGYAALTDAKKKILEDAASSIAALGVINYDMSGYTNSGESIQMMNYNWSIKEAALDLLKEKEVAPDFIG